MANLKPKPEPEPKTRPVLDPISPLLYTYTTSPIRSLTISSLSDPQIPLIYIGTLSGNLSLLSINPNKDALILLKTITVINGIPVISINFIPHLRKILILADNSLFLVDSHLTDPVKKLSFIKGGISTIAKRFTSQNNDYSIDRFLHKSNGLKKPNEEEDLTKCHFVVVIGKKLVIFESNSRGDFVILREIQVSLEGIGAITSVIWFNDSIIMGSKSGYYLYSFENGQFGLIFSLPEGFNVPVMKLLRKERKVLLMVDNVGVIVNGDGQPIGGSFIFRGVPVVVGEAGLYLTVVRDGKLELYHKKSNTCIQVIKLEEVNETCFIADEEEDESLNLVTLATNTKVICYRKIPYEEQIKDLLRKKSYKQAISLVQELENEEEISKEMVSFIHAQIGYLLLFDLHFNEAINHFLLSHSMEPSELFPFIIHDPNRWSLLVPRNRYWGLHPPPLPLESVVENGLKDIERAIFLKKAGVETSLDDTFILNRPTKASLMESAIKNMIKYFESSRNKDLALSVKEGVDTLLMHLYRALNQVNDMEKLVSSQNFCVVEELESLLNESGHLRALAFLYASKGFSSKALNIWRVLSRDYDLNKENLAVIEASKILEESSDQALVLQHLGWIADIDQVLAVQVLISDKRDEMLSPEEVIKSIDPKKVEILEKYLQWLIEDKECDENQFHTTYALILAKSALESHEINTYDSIFETPVRERLQSFLESSYLYDPEEVLDLIQESELWVEKAILYRKLGQETQVLQILALKLENFEGAEQYCAEIGRADAYTELLEMYLDPKYGKKPMLKAAIRLLHYHGESLNPTQILERLSADTPLQDVSETILRILRARVHHYRQGQIVHSLSKGLDVDAKLAREEERSRHVVINDESVCDSCHGRLGTKLFAMYPDDTIVCYKCYRKQGDSVSVTGRDFNQHILYKPGWLVTS